MLLSGCGGLSELKPPQVNADEAAAAAIEAYDANSDGQLSEEEFAKLHNVLVHIFLNRGRYVVEGTAKQATLRRCFDQDGTRPRRLDRNAGQ